MSSPNEPVRPTADALNEFEYGRYVLANLAAKRAKQLKDGAPPLVKVDSHNPLTIALAEIAAGKIRANLPTDTTPLAVTDIPVDDALPSELGILLPSLDELDLSVDEDMHEDDELEHDTPSLASLLDDDGEVDTVAPEHEDSVSLSDLAIEEGQDGPEAEQDA